MNKISRINTPNSSNTMTPNRVIVRIQKLYESQNAEKAVNLTNSYVKKYKMNLPLHVALAALAVSYNKKELATTLLENVLRSDPKNARGLYNRGLLYLKNNDFTNAKKLFSEALLNDRNYTSAIQNLLYILVNTNEVSQIKKWYKKLITDENILEQNLVLFVKAFKSTGLNDDFVSATKILLHLNSESFESNFNFALAMQRTGQLKKAEEFYNYALLIKPNDLEASNNLAKLHFDDGNIASAIKILEKTNILTADKPAILQNMGVALYSVGEIEKAKKYLTRSVELNPEVGDPHYTLGLISKDKNEYEEAHKHFTAAIKNCDPETSMYTDSVAQKWLLARYSLDWKISETTQKYIPDLGIRTAHIAPFSALPMEDNPENQLLRSKNFSNKSYGSTSDEKRFLHYKSAEIINIAYLSADFHQFPGMTLMSGMFSAHDRSKFRVFALSYGPDRNDSMRKKIVQDVDKFIDVKDFTDNEIVSLCSNLNIHIAIHRNGFTKLHRTGIFAKRAAPIQVNYLGYPSTMGASFIDYMVADPFVITEKYRKYYSENLIYMPNCYQPNDNSRKWPQDLKGKADHGLDGDKIVLCCFNNPYKISRTELKVWADILLQRANTQLWLLDPGERGQKNVEKYFKSQGLHKNRVVFANKTDHESHLARHIHADIFVDTFNYNAHTTATDALGMGLPVVTMSGKQFCARVAGSILGAAGLEELVTHDKDWYKKKILELIDNEDLRNSISQKCLVAREKSALFDTESYIKSFESGLEIAFEKFKLGHQLNDIYAPN